MKAQKKVNPSTIRSPARKPRASGERTMSSWRVTAPGRAVVSVVFGVVGVSCLRSMVLMDLISRTWISFRQFLCRYYLL